MKLQLDEWQVRDLDLTPPKVAELWRIIQRHGLLFSDLTKGDAANFIRCLTAPHTMWFEVRKHGILVGLIWFGELDQVVDTNAHMMFFDRMPVEKMGVCKHVIQWMFNNFPLQRITAEIPALHMATNRMMVNIGFKYEGMKFGSVLFNRRWRDSWLFGMTRQRAQTLHLEVTNGLSRR